MGRRGHGPPPGLRQNPPGPGRYHSTLPHLPSPRPGRWTPPLSLTSASTVAMAGAPERSPAPSAAPHASAPPLSPHSSQWRRSAGQRACVRQHGGPHGAPLAVRCNGGACQEAAVQLEQGWDGDRRSPTFPSLVLVTVVPGSPKRGCSPSHRGFHLTTHGSNSAHTALHSEEHPTEHKFANAQEHPETYRRSMQDPRRSQKSIRAPGRELPH